MLYFQNDNLFELLERFPFSLRHDFQYEEEERYHQHGKEHEHVSAAEVRECQWKREADYSVHYPIDERTERLPLRPDPVREYFGQEHPDDGSLREGKERHKEGKDQ